MKEKIDKRERIWTKSKGGSLKSSINLIAPKETDQKFDKLDFIKIENFYISKALLRKWKGSHIQEKIFVIYIYYKGLVSRIPVN